MSIAVPTVRIEVLADRWSRSRATNVVTVLGATTLTALCAQIAIPIPGSPVPVTGQTFAVLLTAAAIGPVRGALAQVLYLALAVLGVPVLADQKSGVSVVTGATAGYLIGFVVAAAAVGWLARQGWSRKPLQVAISYLAGSAIIYVLGVSWLAYATGNTLSWAVTHGLTPFVVGDLVKALVAAGLLPLAWRAGAQLRGEDKPS